MRNTLSIPCKYFIKRGYSPTTLDNFDVGMCYNKNSSIYMRAVVPIYDIAGNNLVGYNARSINDKCKICGTFHYYKHPCPRNIAETNFARKWKNSQGFSSGKTLYNIWNINKNTVIVVEGAGDVWKLYEAGYNNSVALFGCNLTSTHIQQLMSKNVENVVLCLDNDTAGQTAVEKIINQIDMYFNYKVVTPTKKDVGDMDTESIHRMLSGAKKWQLLD